jgi:hypothetical protein
VLGYNKHCDADKDGWHREQTQALEIDFRAETTKYAVD